MKASQALVRLLRTAIDAAALLFCVFCSIFFEPYYFLKGRLFRQGLNRMAVKKILLLHFDSPSIARAVLSTAAIEPLFDSFPNADIHLLCNDRTRSIFENNPLLRRVMVTRHSGFYSFKAVPFGLKLRREHYGVCISMGCSIASHLVALLSGAGTRVGWSKKCSGFPLNKRAECPKIRKESELSASDFLLLLKPLGIEQEKLAEASLFASAGAVSKIEALLSAEGVLGKQNVAGIFPGGTPKGNLAPLGRDGIASLADMLAESSSAIPAFVGSAAETQQSAAIIDLMRNKERALDFSGKFNTDEMVAFCKACRVFFSNDWESLQLASGAGALAVSLAGKTAEEALEEAKGQLR